MYFNLEKKNLLYKRKIQSKYFHLIPFQKSIIIWLWQENIMFLFWVKFEETETISIVQPPRNEITLDYCQTQKVLFYIHLMISDDFTGMAKSTFLLMSDSISDTFSYTVHLQNHQWSFSFFELSCLALSCFFSFSRLSSRTWTHRHIDKQTKEWTTIKPTNKQNNWTNEQTTITKRNKHNHCMIL